MNTNRTARIPTYSRDPRSGRGFARYVDPKTKKRVRQWFPGEFGSAESRGSFREFILKFTGRHEATAARKNRERLKAISVAELMELWVADYARRFGERSKNVSAAVYAAAAACRDHAVVRAASFEAGDLRAIRERLAAEDRLSRDGVNRQVYAIRRAFRWAREESLIPASVPVDLEAVRGVPRNEGRSMPDPTTADAEVAKRIIEYLRTKPDKAAAGRVVAFLRWTGARPSEANRATVGMLAADQSRLVIPARLAKTSRDRVIPLNAEARAVVDEAITAGGSINPAAPIFQSSRGKPFTSSGILQAMTKAADALGLPRTTAYSLRRLAATEVLIATGSEAAAAAVLGHSTRSKVIERYTRNRADLAVTGAESIGRATMAG